MNLCMNRLTKIATALLVATAMILFSCVGTVWADDTGDAAAPATSSPPTSAPPTTAPPATASADPAAEEEEVVVPWDFDPYRILIWVVSDEPGLSAAAVEPELRAFLDRQFHAIWRADIADAPTTVASVARRDLTELTYESITASDPVFAVKRNHKDAVRIRVAANVAQYVTKVFGTAGGIEMAKARGAEAGNEGLDGAADKFEAIEGDALKLRTLWADEKTEALLTTRGFAEMLDEPRAKFVQLPINGLVAASIDQYDKVFIVTVKSDLVPHHVSVVEFSTLMRYFGAPVKESFVSKAAIPDAMGHALTRAFSPEVRIDEAGLKGAQGLTRAGGLLVDPKSDFLVKPGELLLPMIRKNDRNGRPILIGPLDWAYLLAIDPVAKAAAKKKAAAEKMKAKGGGKGKEGGDKMAEDKMAEDKKKMPPEEQPDPSRVVMELYSGRIGGLAGRKNSRTFRRAIRIRPEGDQTLVRLHAKGKPEFPLIGYELYEKELYSTKMTFVGRTDWNGRLNIATSEDPLRLLYVKNGGAVLARLPIVPGYTPREVADLAGDDMRLQAEAYVNGISNSIIDLVALRKLLGTRIINRLKKGQMKEAEDLLLALREQPTKELLAADLDRKLAYFLKAIGPRNANAKKKVDNMFSTTREMLDKQISARQIAAIEEDFIRAKSQGGRLPEDPDEEEKYDPSVNQGAVEEPKKKKK